MRYLPLFVILTFFFALNDTSSSVVFADDDYEEYDEWNHDRKGHEEERYKEVGEVLGWGIVVTMGIAGVFYPMRRLTKYIITTFPTFKKNYISMTKFLGKYHILIGITAVIVTVCHGIIMYMSEGRLDMEGIVGLIAFVLLLLAGIMGSVLWKDKKVKSLRTTHTALIAFSIIIGVFHILSS